MCPFVLTGKLIVEATTVLSDAVMCLMKVQASSEVQTKGYQKRTKRSEAESEWEDNVVSIR